MNKVTIIGAGNVGATAALFIAQKGLANIVLIDIVEGLARGKSLDIWQAMTLFNRDITILGGTHLDQIRDSNIVVITAGKPRLPDMSRNDLYDANKKVVTSVCENIKKYAPDAVVIIVTNPLDIICHLAFINLGFPKHKVIGMAGVLDSARYRTFIADSLKISVTDVQALVLGSHGNLMVPLIKYTTVKGIPLDSILTKNKIDKLIQKTRLAGEEIVNLLKTGSAFCAPAAAICSMVEAIITENNNLLSCSAYLEGEYGINDVFMSVPCILNRQGIKEIKVIDITKEEKEALQESAADIRKTLHSLNINS